jgi:hypothetical protein
MPKLFTRVEENPIYIDRARKPTDLAVGSSPC